MPASLSCNGKAKKQLNNSPSALASHHFSGMKRKNSSKVWFSRITNDRKNLVKKISFSYLAYVERKGIL